MIIESSQVIFDLEVNDIIAIKADFYVVCLYCFPILYKLKIKRFCQLSVSPLIGRILEMFIVENAQFSSCCFSSKRSFSQSKSYLVANNGILGHNS